jgi:exodeoxyribonuclease VIII
MRLGTLWHCAVLEAEQLERRYAPTYLDRKGTKAWADAEAMAMGRQLIKRADYEEALRVRDAVFQNPTARTLLTGLNSVEQSIFWRDPVTGLLCRGRADGIRTDMRAILDVKTTVDASKSAFAKTAAEYKYHWQNAMYEDGVFEAESWAPDAFIFMAIEKEEPWLIGLYELDRREVEHARGEVRRQIDRYDICLRDDVWPGYSEHIETINLPAWAFKETL